MFFTVLTWLMNILKLATTLADVSFDRFCDCCVRHRYISCFELSIISNIYSWYLTKNIILRYLLFIDNIQVPENLLRAKHDQ